MKLMLSLLLLATAAPAVAEEPITLEHYYRIKWGSAGEFKTLVREDKIFISDRKLVKLYKLFRVRSWLFSGGAVTKDDLRLLAYLGEPEAARRRVRVVGFASK